MILINIYFPSRWQDIVVGAPQFYVKGGDIGGAVYVYINKAGVWDGITPVRLNGTKDSMFGVAVENIGDVNQDLYKGNADRLCLLLLCLYHLQSPKLCLLLMQILPLELRMKIPGSEKSTFITAPRKESEALRHRWMFV